MEPDSFHRYFVDYVSPGNLLLQNSIANPVVANLAIGPVLNLLEEKNVIQSLYYTQHTFAGGINVRRLEGGEILVRCCERASREPGIFWSQIRDMPLSIADIRNRIAVLPNWNQDCNLEFFVVPEGCNIVVLSGRAASQPLISSTNEAYWMMPLGVHFRCIGQGQPEFLNPAGAAIAPGVGGLGQIQQNCHLLGGGSQVVITGNKNGSAFFIVNHPAGAQGYMPCITLLETGFDREVF
jgi:hypothetical protein